MEVYKITRNGKKLEVMETCEIRAQMLSCAAMWKTEEQKEIAKKEGCPIGSSRYNMYYNNANSFNSMAQALLLSLRAMGLITEDEYKNYSTEEGGERA